MILTLQDVIKAVGSKTDRRPQGGIRGVSVDTRSIKQGDLFIPIIGEHYDGHDFISIALDKGASACLCDLERYRRLASDLSSKDIFPVEDTKDALLDLSRFYRRKFSIPFIAVTGSVGKTTTKDIISQVLMEKYKVLKTPGNFNNEIGLPLTLFDLRPFHEICVVEMGMRGPGEIAKLAEVVSPEVAVITNIGISHIERLHSRENIARAKLELLEFLNETGLAILNADMADLEPLNKFRSTKKIFYGAERGDLIAVDIRSLGTDGMKFKIEGDYGNVSFKIPLPGLHNVYNALAAIATGFHFKLTLEQVTRGLEKLKPGHMRLEVKKSPSGALIIDDSYNASPDSVEAALDFLKTLGKCRGAVLGDMLELGEYAKEAHFRIGHLTAKSADVLLAVGRYAQTMAEGARQGGMSDQEIFTFETTSQALSSVVGILSKYDAILVKASRGMKMEQLSQKLLEEA